MLSGAEIRRQVYAYLKTRSTPSILRVARGSYCVIRSERRASNWANLRSVGPKLEPRWKLIQRLVELEPVAAQKRMLYVCCYLKKAARKRISSQIWIPMNSNMLLVLRYCHTLLDQCLEVLFLTLQFHILERLENYVFRFETFVQSRWGA